jgi:uncharacterized protein with von Willebrand factor type A (vWA) domain
MTEGIASLVGFGHVLRRKGVPVGPAHIRTFCEAAAELEPEDLYWAGRASLVWRPEHIPIYDETFRRYFGASLDDESDDEETPREAAQSRRTFAAGQDDETTGSAEGTASPAEVLHEKSFARCTEEEWAQIAALLARLPAFLPRRRSRRYEPRRPGKLHVRRVLRRAAATDGEPFRLSERRRRLRVRPLVFLLDVSGSMAEYSRGLLLFAHAVARTTPDTLVYTFGTQLTDITTAAAGRTFDSALVASGALVQDWDGGTRIGHALEEFLTQHGREAKTRRAIVFICSDGLETGDPVFLREQIERLHRSVHRVVWLNPLKEDPRYEPLARGMRTALPHIDVFESGHSVASLLSVLRRLAPHHSATSGAA